MFNMKRIVIVFFGFIIGSIYAQPTAYDIREAISSSVAEQNIQPEHVFRIINKEISGKEFSIPIRIYYPSDEDSLPILYHIHGAGWAAGNLDTHDNICRRLANETKSIVVAVDYRRPPEHPYPTPLEDCQFILNWIDKNQQNIKGNGKLFLIGDSAGGQLVPALSLKNLEEEFPVKIDGQILINPAVDLRDTSDAYKTYPYFIDWYVPKNINKDQPYISPLVSDRFSEMPQSAVVISENDEIREDGFAFHNLMLQHNSSSSLFEIKGLGHLGGLWAGISNQVQPVVEFVANTLNDWSKD